MSDPLFVKYSAINEAPIYENPKIDGDGQRVINKILLGTWVGVLEETADHYRVRTAGPDGWMLKEHTSDHMGLKIFFIDVGQGDGILIEVGKLRILVDGGPNSQLKNYLTNWQFTYLLKQNEPIHLDYVFVSHFDVDHFEGLIEILSDNRFTFGTLYHNGIARFNTKKAKRPAEYNTFIGATKGKGKKRHVTTSFDTLDDLKELRAKGGLAKTFDKFAIAIINANDEGRLQNFARATYSNDDIVLNTEPSEYKIEFLGPVTSIIDNQLAYKWFAGEGPTVNGHSLVLKLTYGDSTVLLGGDLNCKSEKWLMDEYGVKNPFEVDVAKSCHHGSSDFNVKFMQRINPFATVISSGDNEIFSHPRADAIGSAGRYSRGIKPKVFSTGLARSINVSGDILFGMINLRSNGSKIYMAQMKESNGGSDVWDSYTIE